jgi:hypothetical protein
MQVSEAQNSSQGAKVPHQADEAKSQDSVIAASGPTKDSSSSSSSIGHYATHKKDLVARGFARKRRRHWADRCLPNGFLTKGKRHKHTQTNLF